MCDREQVVRTGYCILFLAAKIIALGISLSSLSIVLLLHLSDHHDITHESDPTAHFFNLLARRFDRTLKPKPTQTGPGTLLSWNDGSRQEQYNNCDI